MLCVSPAPLVPADFFVGYLTARRGRERGTQYEKFLSESAVSVLWLCL